MIERLRSTLAERQIQHINDSKKKESAVLLPLFFKQGHYHILFIQRTERVRDHKGQISFPGGAYKKTDGLLLNTALRETKEEIGVAPKDVRVLGQLDDELTTTSNYIISPFVGVIPYPYNFKLDKWETEELIEVPTTALLEKGCFSEGVVLQHGEEISTIFFKYGDRIIWGATAKILKQFLEIFDSLQHS